MAWISVHEQVLGGKLRKLAKEIGCSQNEALGLLVRLWLWGINNADKEGRIIGAEKDDVAEVLAIGIDTRLSPSEVVEALIKTKWIDIKEDLFLHDWDEWQEQWYKVLTTRENDKERKRRERERKREEKKLAESTVNSESKKEAELIPEKTEESKQKESSKAKKESKVTANKTEYSNEFEEFWKVYPRKVGKGDAYRCYCSRLKNGWKAEDLLEAAINYAAKSSREGIEIKFIKHPSTFLSFTEPFADYVSTNKGEPIASQVTQETTATDDDMMSKWRESHGK